MPATSVPRTYYLGRNDLDGTVLFAIGQRRYTYPLTPTNRDTVEYLCHKVSILKGLNFAKRRAINLARISAPSTS